MRILTPILFIIIVVFAAQAQNDDGLEKKITISAENTSLSQFLNKLSDVTRLSIVYANTLTDPYSVTIPNKEYTVKEVLELALKETKLLFRVEGRSIMILSDKKKDQGVEPTRQQGRMINGIIYDNAGSVLPGVSVYVKGTQRGTTSDQEGRYGLDVEPTETIVLSYIGYKTVEHSVGDRSIIDVVMEEDIQVLGEVTIKGGYYETTDKLKTGSIVRVTGKDIEKQPVTNPLMALQGRVAGLEIIPTTGAPSAAPKIRIRGLNSLRNSNDNRNGNFPLYVIDGVPINSVPIDPYGPSQFEQSGYDPLSTLNMANIASIEILKDGDATAIYGSRGANGVILITTKRNVKSIDRTNFDFSVYSGVGKLSSKMDVLNTQQYLEMRREAFRNDNTVPADTPSNSDLLHYDSTRYTDWQKVLLGGTANITDVQTGISSGNKHTSFSLSFGYHNETMIYPGDFGYRKGNGSLTVSHTSTDEKFNATVMLNYGADKSRMFSNQMMLAALSLPPNAPSLYDANGNLNWDVTDFEQGLRTGSWRNPLSLTLQTYNLSTQNLLTNGDFSYQLTPSIKVATRLGYTDLENQGLGREPKSSFAPQSGSAGTANFSNVRRSSWIAEPELSYLKKRGNSQLNAIIGTSWQQATSNLNVTNGSLYSSDYLLGSLKGAGKVTTREALFSDYKYNSIYGRVGYNLNQKYILNLTGRRDGSSRFGPGHKFANFWAVGGAWIFSEESFMKNLGFINLGKLRASYGTTGSDNIGDYKYYNLYDRVSTGYQGIAGFVPSSLYNPDFAWEITRKLEAALELGFFQNRISAEVNWYRNRSSNQLVDYSLPATTGFPSVLQNFGATIQNTGVEIMVRGEILQSDIVRWNASFNLTFPHNKLVRFDGIENSPYVNLYRVGEPLTLQLLYQYKGLNSKTGLYEVEDRNTDGVINTFDKILANMRGNIFYGGINNTIQYKTLELSFLIQLSHQKVPLPIYAQTPGLPYNQPVSVLDRWQKEGDVAQFQRFSVTGGNPSPSQSYADMYNSTYNITDGSFIRLKTASFGFQLPQAWAYRARLQQAKIFLQGQNLFTITKYKGLDPETLLSLPPLRMITAGIQLRF